MSDKRTTVLLTGATGNWGRAALREFAERADRIKVVALVLPSEADKAALAEFADMENLEVAWGDLTDYGAVEAAVSRVDIVLHVGAVVSPLADARPALARKVNIGSMRNIVKAVQAQPDPGAIAVVGVGSVAETGNRNPPRHWGRVGDPVRVSQFDEYGQTKVVAERELVDSGLPKWVWLRQTGIFSPGMLDIKDPIMTHSPNDGVMEWASAEDSARLLANLCEPDVPGEFWNGIYNIGGGEGWRLTNWQLRTALSDAMGVKDPRKHYDRNWFALKNFHGQWYSDSDRLQDLVPFREDTLAAAIERALDAKPHLRKAGKAPAWLVKHFVMKPLTRQPRGTMHAIRSGNEAEIAAHFGSLEAWKAIGDWSTFTPPSPSRIPTYLDHGYDESKPSREWGKDDYAGAAAFRGGRLLSSDPVTGLIAAPLDWECAEGHAFAASPRLVLTGGHWCPECVKDSAGYLRQAERNPFLAQVATA